MPEEKKSTYTAARKRAVTKYLSESVDEFKVRVSKGKKEIYQRAAMDAGLSLNQFTIDAIEEKIQTENVQRFQELKSYIPFFKPAKPTDPDTIPVVPLNSSDIIASNTTHKTSIDGE